MHGRLSSHFLLSLCGRFVRLQPLSKEITSLLHARHASFALAVGAERVEEVEGLLVDSSTLILGEGGSSEQLIPSSMQRAQGSAPSHRARDRRHGGHPSMHLSSDKPRRRQAVPEEPRGGEIWGDAVKRVRNTKFGRIR